MKLEIINKSNNPMPSFETKGSAGMDLRANIQNNFNDLIIIEPKERVLIKTGIFLNMSDDLEAQIRPRSGLAYKHGITVLNSPGTIDSDYKDEVGVLLINHGTARFIVNNGDRIAQMVFSRIFRDSKYIKDNTRLGGFGSTNIN